MIPVPVDDAGAGACRREREDRQSGPPAAPLRTRVGQTHHGRMPARSLVRRATALVGAGVCRVVRLQRQAAAAPAPSRAHGSPIAGATERARVRQPFCNLRCALGAALLRKTVYELTRGKWCVRRRGLRLLSGLVIMVATLPSPGGLHI